MRRFIVEESISMLKRPRFRLPETGALRFVLFVYQMTGDTVAGGDLLHFRGALTAAVSGVGAAGVEHAALKFIGVLGQLPGEGNLPLPAFDVRDGGKQFLWPMVYQYRSKITICTFLFKGENHFFSNGKDGILA